LDGNVLFAKKDHREVILEGYSQPPPPPQDAPLSDDE
jgi:hypothetical protein